MIDRMQLGEVPAKPHIAFRSREGVLRFEECLTRRGFDGEFSILYHEGPPMTDSLIGPATPGRWDRKAPIPAEHQPLRRRLLLGARAPEGYTPVLFNDDVTISFFRLPREAESPDGFSNGDGDDLYFFYEGEGTVETPFGDVPVRANDYLAIPRGVVHRVRISSPFEGVLFELRGGLHLPKEFRNPVGQLRMDAPYTHRDFVRPAFKGPHPGPKRILVKKDDAFVERFPAASPFDVVGWDGTVWPFAFDILKYQPKTGLVHLPPTIHATFAGRNALLCSFVPRVTDTHPDAIPCPYPHASVDCDEVIYYVRGTFTSRKGVGPKAVSLHPAGVPHGPHPGAYEGSIGTRSTDELAVMMDTFAPLRLTAQALALESPGYHDSWMPG
ncbi:MAG TPA: homogentisate 1,2-dioxygenase [Thermoanaerobaculia bacterium]|nr:homogentisate 1,2-dioxygenase [Thermoanaerobaculia bacterium]